MLTKGKVDSMSKVALVNKVLELQTKVEDSSNTPLTEARIVKKQLTLADNAINATVRVKELDVQLALDQDRLKKEHELATIKELSVVTDEFNDLQEDIADVKKALTTSITVQEAETNEVLAGLAEKVEVAKQELADAVELRSEKTKEAEATYKAKLAEFAAGHTRSMDEQEYEHKTAETRLDEDYAKSLAAKLSKSLICSDELQELKSIKPLEATEIATQVKAEIGKAVGMEKSRSERALSDANHAAELVRITVEAEVKGLKAQLATSQANEVSLTAQVKEIPAVIEKAVKAANADISVHNETGKK